MNRDAFEKTLSAWLDGALDADEAHAFEEHVRNSPALQARVAEAQRFDGFLRDRLGAPADPAAKERILNALRREAAAASPREVVRPWFHRFRPMALPAAAAVIAFALWAGGLFDATPQGDGHHHDPIVDVVLSQDEALMRNLADAGGNKDFSATLRGLLVKAPRTESRVWNASADMDLRRADSARLFKTCTQKDVPIPAIPRGFQLVGARVVDLTVDGMKLAIPHLIFYSPDHHLSIYMLCKTQARVLEERIPGGLAAIHGCPSCGVAIKEAGDFLMILVTDIRPPRLNSLADEI
ncbi:MAG TPA: hypothetical protein ENK43_10860 [Planctomycetes bacterium]|nr:hypothetical protein [Planctomycetota bacterium]